MNRTCTRSYVLLNSKFQFRASVRTFNPKQLKYEDKSDIKFKHSVFMRNVNREMLG